MLTNQADAPRAINADQQLVYPPADVARRLGISGAGLRRLAQGYERVFNPLPRDTKHGRLWPESAVRQMETARAMVGAGKATSVEAALDTLAHDNPTVNALDVRNAYGDEYEASWEVLVQVLRALRVKLEHQQLRLASLETDVRVLRARSPESRTARWARNWLRRMLRWR